MIQDEEVHVSNEQHDAFLKQQGGDNRGNVRTLLEAAHKPYLWHDVAAHPTLPFCHNPAAQPLRVPVRNRLFTACTRRYQAQYFR